MNESIPTSKVNVRRTKAQDAEATKKLETEVGASNIVERDGQKFAVSTSFGMTLETRIS